MTDTVQVPSESTSTSTSPTATPEQLNDLRQRVLAGQDVSVEEYRILLSSLRAVRSGDIERGNTTKRAGTAKALTPKATVALPSIFDDL